MIKRTRKSAYRKEKRKKSQIKNAYNCYNDTKNSSLIKSSKQRLVANPTVFNCRINSEKQKKKQRTLRKQ